MKKNRLKIKTLDSGYSVVEIHNLLQSKYYVQQIS